MGVLLPLCCFSGCNTLLSGWMRRETDLHGPQLRVGSPGKLTLIIDIQPLPPKCAIGLRNACAEEKR